MDGSEEAIENERGEGAAGTAQDNGEFRELLEKLSGRHNFDFREYKPTSLRRRIRSRMAQVKVERFEDYGRYLDRHPDEYAALFNAILINITGFFRDPKAWEAVREQVLPSMVSSASETKALRIWSAGCSSGEEPYSMAILLAEHLGETAHSFDVKIYATDADDEALNVGRHGLYRLDQLKEVPEGLIGRYFTPEGQLYRLRRELRRWCVFGRHNLTQDAPLSHVDMVICRNVLIYFRSELQERILPKLHYALRDGGFLFLGKSESLLARSRRFVPVSLKWRIFQRVTPAAEPVILPLVAPRNNAEERGGQDERISLTLQSTLDAVRAAVIVIDARDTVLAWNLAAEDLFGIPAPSAIGRRFRDLDVSYRVEGLRARVEEVKTGQAFARIEDVSFSRRRGDTVQADIAITALHDATDELTGVVVTASDTTEAAQLKSDMARVTEQHATAIEELQSTNEELETTNEELQSSNEELETTNEELQSTNEELETTVDELQAVNIELATLNTELERRTAELDRADTYHQAIVDSVENGIVVLDGEGRVTTWSQGAARMFGLPAEHAVGRLFFSLPLGDAARLAREPAERVLKTGISQQIGEIPYVLPGGKTRRASMRLAPLVSPNGERLGVVAAIVSEGEG